MAYSNSSRSAQSSPPARRCSHFRTWLIIGVALTASVMLADLSRLLGSVESSGLRAYDAQVFTGFYIRFWDTAELGDAIRLWREAQDQVDVKRLLCWHLVIDAVVFIPAYCALIGLGLLALGGKERHLLAWGMALALL